MRSRPAELAQLARERQRVIYGVDNRRDVYQVTSSTLRAAANAVVALVRRSALALDGQWWIRAVARGRTVISMICAATNPSRRSRSAASAPGFWLPECIATPRSLREEPDRPRAHALRVRLPACWNQARPHCVPHQGRVRGCPTSRSPNVDDGTDWALVQLDRPVTGHKPLKVRTTGKIGDKQSLFVIGHPTGLPQKYAPRAKVRDNTPAAFFVANLDTYGGNSGSPVFNSSNRVVEGILVRGESDFVSNGSCFVSLVCPTTGCRGEDVMRAPLWATKIPKSSKAASRAAPASKRKALGKRRKR